MIRYITEDLQISPNEFDLESSGQKMIIKKQVEYSKYTNTSQIKTDQYLVMQAFVKINM